MPSCCTFGLYTVKAEIFGGVIFSVFAKIGGSVVVKPVLQVGVLLLHVNSIGCTDNFGAFFSVNIVGTEITETNTTENFCFYSN